MNAENMAIVLSPNLASEMLLGSAMVMQWMRVVREFTIIAIEARLLQRARSSSAATQYLNLATDPSLQPAVGQDAVAQFDFAGKSAGDLSFKEGDRIRVVKLHGDGWAEGFVVSAAAAAAPEMDAAAGAGLPGGGQRRGDFPLNHVAARPPASAPWDECREVLVAAGLPVDEGGAAGLPEGAVLSVAAAGAAAAGEGKGDDAALDSGEAESRRSQVQRFTGCPPDVADMALLQHGTVDNAVIWVLQYLGNVCG